MIADFASAASFDTIVRRRRESLPRQRLGSSKRCEMAKSNDDQKRSLGSSFFRVTREESADVRKVLTVLLFSLAIEQDGELVCDEGGENSFAILLYGEGFQKLASYSRPPTLLVDDRPLLLPEPDGMLYVLGPMLQFHRIEVRAEKLEHYLEEGLMDEF